MPQIFISYRRAVSSGQAGRLYDRLVQAYDSNSIFLDVEQIPIGETFDSYILRQIDKTDVFLALLAEGTFDRIHNQDDWVRREIAYALNKENIRVVPVLVDNFRMPDSHDLPEDIQALTRRNAAFLYHQMFDASVDDIVAKINSCQEAPADNSFANEALIEPIQTTKQENTIKQYTNADVFIKELHPNSSDRLSISFNQIISSAMNIAKSLNNGVLSSEHILLALLKNTDTTSSRILMKCDVYWMNTLECIQNFPANESQFSNLGDDAFYISLEASKVFYKAINISLSTGEYFVGNHHILFGLVTEGVNALRILHTLEVPIEKLRQLTIESL